MELRQLRHFLAVVDGGSLGDAARQLRISQPSLTKSIQALERSVGGPLFERSAQGMKPTALGRGLEARARVIAGEVGRAEREINELVGAQRGKVVIGTGPSFAHAILPTALARFYRTHPAIEVAVVDGLLRNILPLVKTGAIDYAFYVAPDDLAKDDLAHEVLLPGERISVVTTAGNPLALKRQVTMKEIWGGPWTLPVEECFRKQGLSPPRPVVEHASIYAAKSILREGIFIASFMEMLIEDEIERKDLVRVNVPELSWKVDHGVIYRREVPLSLAAQKLLEQIRAVCTSRRSDRTALPQQLASIIALPRTAVVAMLRCIHWGVAARLSPGHASTYLAAIVAGGGHGAWGLCPDLFAAEAALRGMARPTD